MHRIRVDYYNGGGPGALHLNWRRPEDGIYTNIPGQYLRPRYGLTTSTETYESNGVPNPVSETRYAGNGLDATYGLVTSTVQAGSTVQTSYETPGSGYLRRTARTMPSGAQTRYEYYPDTETRDNPCTPAADPVNQGGLVKKTISPTPAAGSARVDEQIYDASGRMVARSTSGDWSCTRYDARDRVVEQTIPSSATSSARTVVTDHAVGGDPLTTSMSDSTGTVITRTDLLGRTVSYTDVHGTRTDTKYDQAGRTATETVTPPNTSDAPQVTTPTYDDAGRVMATKVGTLTLANATYNPAGELVSVTYANGTSMAAVGRDDAGRITSQTWRTSDGHETVSTVTRTRSGTIVDESLGGVDPRPAGANYTYDSRGNLVEAWVPGHHYTYDFTSAAPSTCPTGSQSNAGANTNRMRLVDETPSSTNESGYCYDAADRLLATTGANSITGVTYNSHGATTGYTRGSAVTTLTWDGADRNTSLRVTGADPAVVSYTRDATDRITRRQATQGDTATDVLYSYTGSGDSADIALASDKRVLTRSISLPGDVLYTVKAGGTTWDFPSVRGVLCLTTGDNGQQVGELRSYTPFGEPVKTDGTINADNVPDNQPGQMDNGWLGQYQRPYEHAGSLAIVQMGARPYDPSLGRFLAVDPVDGGSSNDYDYSNADPVNGNDLDGQWCIFCKRTWKAIGSKIAGAGRWVWKHRGVVATVAATAWCIVPAVGWASCGAAQAGAYAIRTQQKVAQNGWRNSRNSIIADGIGTALTFGLASSMRYVRYAKMMPWVQRGPVSSTWAAMSRWGKMSYLTGLNGTNWIKTGGCAHRQITHKKPC